MTGRVGIRGLMQLLLEEEGWLAPYNVVTGSVQETIISKWHFIHDRKSEGPHVQQVFFFNNIKFRAAWVLQHGNSLNTATPKCLAQKKGGRERRGDVVGVRGGLTKNHFNRNSWVMALPQAKNNISSMSAVRRRLSQAPRPAPASSQAQASLWLFPELVSSHICPPRGQRWKKVSESKKTAGERSWGW